MKTQRLWPLCLLLVSLCYAAWLVIASPVLGYANNYDFIRQSACLGIWHNHPEVDKFSAYSPYPADSLIYDGQARPGNCEPSSDMLFLHLLAQWHKVGEVIPLWHLGLLKLLATLLVCLLVWPRAAAGRGLATAWLVVLAFEWALLAYANTLYAEYSVLLGFLLVALAGMAACEPAATGQRRGFILLLGGLLFLATTKQQWAIWALLLSAGYLVLYLLQRRYRPAAMLVLVLAGLALALLQHNRATEQQPSQVELANLTNTYLYTVLPAATDVPAALATLGLPAHCAAGVGRSWYSPGMAAQHPCPELRQQQRLHLLKLFASQPRTLTRPLRKGIDRLRQPAPQHLGVINPADPHAVRKLQWARALAPSHWLGQAPRGVFRALAVMAIVAGPLAFVALCWQLAGRRRPSLALYWLALGGLACGYSLFSSLFGDGYIDLHRHAILFWPGLYMVLGALLGMACGRWLPSAPRK